MTQFISILIICWLSLFLGWLLTEHPVHALAVRFPRLDRKPFNCRPCLTFHFAWVLFAIMSVISPVIYIVPGIICAFILFLSLCIYDRYRIQK